MYEIRYLLPPDVTCTQCVIQWRYVAKNNWGRCDNATSAIGCGPQEEFRACADISIEDKDGTIDETPYHDVPHTVTTEAEDADVVVVTENNEVDGLHSSREDSFWVSLIIMLAAMILALFIYILIFLYFYGVNKTVKPCWHSTLKSVRHTFKSEGGSVTPVPPSRRKGPKNTQESVVTLA